MDYELHEQPLYSSLAMTFKKSRYYVQRPRDIYKDKNARLFFKQGIPKFSLIRPCSLGFKISFDCETTNI